MLHLHKGHVFRQSPPCASTLINSLCVHKLVHHATVYSHCILWDFPSEIILICLVALFPVIVCLIQCEIPKHSLCFNCTATIRCTVILCFQLELQCSGRISRKQDILKSDSSFVVSKNSSPVSQCNVFEKQHPISMRLCFAKQFLCCTVTGGRQCNGWGGGGSI